jgi:hypothetical protein
VRLARKESDEVRRVIYHQWGVYYRENYRRSGRVEGQGGWQPALRTCEDLRFHLLSEDSM